MSDPYETSAAKAAQPAEYEAGGERIKQHSLRDQIELDDRKAANEQVKKPRAGLRFLGTKGPGM